MRTTLERAEKQVLADARMIRKRSHHKCREHIIERRGSQGGSRHWVCAICERPVSLRMKAGEVLARRTA